MPYKDPEKRLAANRAAGARWREKNREQERARQAAWRAKNRQGELERTRAWARAHPEARAVYNSTFRALRAGVDADLTTSEWEEILREWNHSCAYCQASNVPMTQEHMIPMIRGGRHTRWNVVPACRSCNSQKGARPAGEFLLRA